MIYLLHDLVWVIAAIVCFGVVGLLATLTFGPHNPAPVKLTEAEKLSMLQEMDSWREAAIENIKSESTLDALNEYYNTRRAMIEKNQNPGPIRAEILALSK